MREVITMTKSQYRLDVIYPLDQFEAGYVDAIIEDTIGQKRDSSGSGINGIRDMQFLFETKGQRSLAAWHMAIIGDDRIDTVQRTDLDPVDS